MRKLNKIKEGNKEEEMEGRKKNIKKLNERRH